MGLFDFLFPRWGPKKFLIFWERRNGGKLNSHREFLLASPFRRGVAHIESNGNGYYSVYCEEQFPFGFFGEGCSIEEAKQDFIAVFEAFCADHLKRTGEVVEATFTFVLDESAR